METPYTPTPHTPTQHNTQSHTHIQMSIYMNGTNYILKFYEACVQPIEFIDFAIYKGKRFEKPDRDCFLSTASFEVKSYVVQKTNNLDTFVKRKISS